MLTTFTRTGSDSAPHVLSAKTGVKKAAAGCFTQGQATQLVVGAVEEGIANAWLPKDVGAGVLNEFLSGRGRRFYQLKDAAVERKKEQKILLEKKGEKIPEILKNQDGSVEVAPFRRGEEVWSLAWKS